MTTGTTASDAQTARMRQLVPLNSLSPGRLAALLGGAELIELVPGATVFTAGEANPFCWYLLGGAVELRHGERTIATVTEGTPESLLALSLSHPHRLSARSVTGVHLMRCRRSLLDNLLAAEMGVSAQVEQSSAAIDLDSHDWIGKLLQSPPFNHMSPEHVRALFSALTPVDLASGAVVIREGEGADDYYIIQRGRCLVSRQPSPRSDRQQLAILGPGEAFGEEALLTGAARNATVGMLSEGRLMRLARADFERFVKEPLVRALSFDRALQLAEQRGAVWLDVRDPARAAEAPLRDSLLMPLGTLRVQLQKLERHKPCIVCCDDGRLSTAATFLLAERGIEAYVLEGGLGGRPATDGAGVPAAGMPGRSMAGAGPLADDAVLSLDEEAARLEAHEFFDLALEPPAAETPDGTVHEASSEHVPVSGRNAPIDPPSPATEGSAQGSKAREEVLVLRRRVQELEKENDALRAALAVLVPREPAPVLRRQEATRATGSAVITGNSAPIPVAPRNAADELEITFDGGPALPRPSASAVAAEARQRAMAEHRAREMAARAALKEHDKALLSEVEEHFRER